MKKLLILLAVLPLLCSCNSKKSSDLPAHRIIVGAGPEDMVTDRSQAEPRLLISCTARREGENPFGEIVAYTPSSGKTDTLVRKGMPDSLYFQPHGIFLDSLSTPQVLYVISHERENGFHPVYLWEVHADTLIFKEIAFSNLVYSPNALTLGANGEIYIVNDSGERGNMMEKILKLKRANIVRMDKLSDNNWEARIVAEKLGYPAGINRLGKILYVGDAVNHLLHIYSIEEEALVEVEPIKGLRGNDNIRILNGMIYITGHVKPFKFISHVKSPENLSPVEVWKINPQTREIKSLFYTDGSLISAGSTAVLLNGKLYISQVFESYIIEVGL